MKEVAALFRSARRRLGIVLARKVGALGDPSRRTPRPPRPQPLHEAAALGAAEAPLATRGSSAPRHIYAEQFAQATGPDRTRWRRLISRAALETPGGTPMERPGRLGHCSSSHMRHVRRVNLAAPAGASGWSCSFWPGRILSKRRQCGLAFHTAQSEFKAAWEASKARTSSEQLAAAYKAMNIRGNG